MSKAPELRDWRKVYNWELTKQGKIMFANEKFIVLKIRSNERSG